MTAAPGWRSAPRSKGLRLEDLHPDIHGDHPRRLRGQRDLHRRVHLDLARHRHRHRRQRQRRHPARRRQQHRGAGERQRHGPAGGGNNTVTVGNGNDTIQLGDGSNVVVEGNGNDTVSAGNGNNLIVGGLGPHTIKVGNGTNILIDGSATVNEFRRLVPPDPQRLDGEPDRVEPGGDPVAVHGQLQHEVRQHPDGRQRHRLVLLQVPDDLEQEVHGLPELIARRSQPSRPGPGASRGPGAVSRWSSHRPGREGTWCRSVPRTATTRRPTASTLCSADDTARRVVRSGAAPPSRAGSRRSVPTARCASRGAFCRGISLRRQRQRLGDRNVQRRDRRPSTATPSKAPFVADRAHLNSGSSPSVVSYLLALPRHETDPEIEGSLTLSPQCADGGSGINTCARRPDNTDAG